MVTDNTGVVDVAKEMVQGCLMRVEGDMHLGSSVVVVQEIIGYVGNPQLAGTTPGRVVKIVTGEYAVVITEMNAYDVSLMTANVTAKHAR